MLIKLVFESMPSWPSRLLHGTSAPSNTNRAPQSRGLESPPRKQGQHKTISCRDAPISASMNASSSPSRNRPITHGRSLSHPFTSRLDEDRRTNKRVKSRDEIEGLDAAGDENSDISTGFSRDHTFAGQAASLQHSDKELRSGKCATCGLLMRWPKNVDVFRCTICLMVNDLSSASRASPAADASVNATASNRGKGTRSVQARKGTLFHYFCRAYLDVQAIVTYISLDRSKVLLDHCISQYLQYRLNIRSRVMEDGGPLPSQGILYATAGSEESPDHETKHLRSKEARIPTASTIIEQPERSESMDTSRECQLTIGPMVIPQPLVTNTIVPDPYNPNPGPADYAVPSPIRKPPPPPIERSNHLPNNMWSTVRLSHLGYPKSIFRPLETYILTCFNNCDCLNASFFIPKRSQPARAASEGANATTSLTNSDSWHCLEESLPGLDAKTLLLGDFAENGMWWTGKSPVERRRSHKYGTNFPDDSLGERVSLKSPKINWTELSEWYHVILSTGQSWQHRWQELQASNGSSQSLDKDPSANDLREIGEDMIEASIHLQRTLLKATENLLRRPGRPMKVAEDCRFLFILLANPMLYPPESSRLVLEKSAKVKRSLSHDQTAALQVPLSSPRPNTALLRRTPDTTTGSVAKHSGIIKRILGLMSNTPVDCNHHFVVWFSRLSEAHFRQLVDLVGSFVTYRLTRQHGRKRSNSHLADCDLIPSIASPGTGSSAQLHAALGIVGKSKSSEKSNESIVYGEDWQIKAAAKVMSLLFSANNGGVNFRHEVAKASLSEVTFPGWVARQRANIHGALLPTSSFYNTLLDYSDLVGDFETWESRKGKFSFCQYPMFLSIWAKIHIMEHDARRQMEIKAREAFFTSIMNRKAVSQHLVLKVRRNCLVEDSLRGVSESVGTGQEEIKKGLRIEFSGEEGVDAGGYDRPRC